MSVRREISYEGFNKERWLMSIGFDNVLTVTCNGETRKYNIPERITKIEHDNEYVYLYAEYGFHYQFKFEVNNFLVGDVFTTEDGQFLKGYASYVFGEDNEQIVLTVTIFDNVRIISINFKTKQNGNLFRRKRP